jgi:hypothetical protein
VPRRPLNGRAWAGEKYLRFNGTSVCLRSSAAGCSALTAQSRSRFRIGLAASGLRLPARGAHPHTSSDVAAHLPQTCRQGPWRGQSCRPVGSWLDLVQGPSWPLSTSSETDTTHGGLGGSAGGCEWCGSPFPFQRPGERRDKSSRCGFTYPPHDLPLSPPSCLPSHIGRSVDLDVRSLLLPLHRFCFIRDSPLGYLSYPFPSFSASASLSPAPAPARHHR